MLQLRWPEMLDRRYSCFRKHYDPDVHSVSDIFHRVVFDFVIENNHTLTDCPSRLTF
jgi:hypothetical protein